MKLYGDGRIWQRPRSPFLWCQFSVDGVQQRESTKTTDMETAEKYLRRRKREVAAGEFVSGRDKRRSIEDLMDALEVDFKLREIDSPQNLSNIKRVRIDFGHHKASKLTGEQVDLYVAKRLEDGSAKASVNRVLQLLKQAYKFAKLPAPEIRKLSEVGNARKGFFSESEIRGVIAHLPDYLKDFVLFAWHTGMRKNEIRSLAWENVSGNDVDGYVIRLRAEDSKTGEPRVIPLVGELAELKKRREAAKEFEIDGVTATASLIFHRAGEPIGDIRKSWATACKKAGVRRLFHDLRRSACKNMLAAGVPQSVAMKISGHKTDAMFRRYAVSDETTVRTALLQTQAHQKTVLDNLLTMPKPMRSARAPRGQRGQNGDTGKAAVGRLAGNA